MKKKMFLAGILAFFLTMSCACLHIGDKDSSLNHASSSPNHEISNSMESSIQEDVSSEVTSHSENVLSSEDSAAEETYSSDDSESEESSENTESSVSSESSENTESSESEEEDEAYCTVQFDTDDGTEVPSVTLLKGEKLPQPPTPQKTSKNCEYTFLGWYYNGELWDFELNVVTEDITLIAHWEEGDKFSDPFLPKD
jgi:hypothetical protein